MAIIKHVKTKEKFRGNQYGQIRKHSRIDRYYSVSVDGVLICEDYYLSLNGARLAVEFVKLGLGEAELNRIDCDSVAACAPMMARNRGVKSVAEYLAIIAKEYLVKYPPEKNT